ncbi:MAG TPA: acetyl-CoA C-acetyltransferase [Chloroflexota bacterium]|jgi:acetyl-CoA C-acetyltransferase|nr:acetyl-CoA C-acetyltransferase [Chloroflexota bacterium]
MEDVVIAAPVRTPFGKLLGALKDVSAVELGATAIRATLERANVPFDEVDQVIMGTVVTAGQGQVPARQAALRAGLPVEVSALTINKVCASGLKAVNLAAQMIRAGDADVVVAGGMESMTQAPFLVMNGRQGYRMGDGVLFDAMMKDGLSCPIGAVAMHEYGNAGAAEAELSREVQDEWAMRSQRRYQEALAASRFTDEIVPVTVPGKKGEHVVVDRDDQPRPGTTLEDLANLQPLKEGGTITAGNAPGVNDGAAAMLVLSASRAKELGVMPLARHMAMGEGNDEPARLSRVPAYALRNASKRSGVSLDEIHLFEINEAFAAVALTVMQLEGMDPDEVNVNGGAVAVGHPIGASGARILGTLIYEMRRQGEKYGAAAICSGTGQGEATIVQLIG